MIRPFLLSRDDVIYSLLSDDYAEGFVHFEVVVDVRSQLVSQIFANFPPERMVMELVQNSFDTDASKCEVVVTHDAKNTYVAVTDDHPDGFKNIRDAYTLFGFTEKRSDPTKRGRFNFGEKIVLARAKEATVTTTKGCVRFTKEGRKDSRKTTESGSVINVTFPKWKKKELTQALEVLSGLYVPQDIQFKLNEHALLYQAPLKSVTTKLSALTAPSSSATSTVTV